MLRVCYFISDHVPRTCTQQKICKQVNQPSSTITNPVTKDQVLPPADGLTTVHAPPILLDKSSVPWGQMLPVCQDQFLSASFQSVENNWINPTSAVMNPTSCAVTSAMMSRTYFPQTGLHLSKSHVLWDVSPGLVEPNLIPPPVGQGQIDSPLVGPADSVSASDFTNQPLIPFSMFQTSSSDDLTPEAANQPVSEALCDSRLLQQSDLCSSSPLTDSPQDVVNPFWLDLLLDTSGNMCFPDANLVNIVLSPYTGSN